MNEIFPFAYSSTGDNLYTDQAYQSMTGSESVQSRQYGNIKGIADDKLFNKALRQTSAIASNMSGFAHVDGGSHLTDSNTNQEINEGLRQAVINAKQIFISSDYVMSPSDAMRPHISMYGAKVTLPLLSESPLGAIFHIYASYNQEHESTSIGGPTKLIAQASDIIQTQTRSSTKMVEVNNGEYARFRVVARYDGDKCWEMTGSGAAKYEYEHYMPTDYLDLKAVSYSYTMPNGFRFESGISHLVNTGRKISSDEYQMFISYPRSMQGVFTIHCNLLMTVATETTPYATRIVTTDKDRDQGFYAVARLSDQLAATSRFSWQANGL